MQPARRASGWSAAALWFGLGSTTLGILLAAASPLGGRPWWEHADPAEADRALTAATEVAIALVVAAGVVALVGTAMALLGLRADLRLGPGTPAPGKAFAGLLFSGLAGAALTYAAVRQAGRPDLWAFAALPAGMTALAAVRGYWWWRGEGKAIVAGLTAAEPLSAPDTSRDPL